MTSVLDSAGSLRGRRALVTGASRGIGAAIAERLAFEGVNVAVAARTLDQHRHLAGSLTATLDRLRPSGSRSAAFVVDLADPVSRSSLIERAEDELCGPLDILVNNAAAAMYAPLRSYPAKRRQVTFQVNVEAPMDLAQAVLPGMITRGEGWIVNVSSATAKLPHCAGRKSCCVHDGGLRRIQGRAESTHGRAGMRSAGHRDSREQH